jgi:hypothetical protein
MSASTTSRTRVLRGMFCDLRRTSTGVGESGADREGLLRLDYDEKKIKVGWTTEAAI